MRDAAAAAADPGPFEQGKAPSGDSRIDLNDAAVVMDLSFLTLLPSVVLFLPFIRPVFPKSLFLFINSPSGSLL